MNRAWFACLLLLIPAVNPCAAQDHEQHAVLVSTLPGAPPFTQRELRRFFLGVPAAKGNLRLVPVMNATDEILFRAFLQKVMHLTETGYRHQAAAEIFRHGGVRPRVVENRGALETALRGGRANVTFLYRDEARARPELTVIQELW